MNARVIKNLLLFLGLIVVTQAYPLKRDSLLFHHTPEWNNEQAVYPDLPFKGQGYWEDSTGVLIYRFLIPLPPQFAATGYSLKIDQQKWAPYHGNLANTPPSGTKRAPMHRVIHIKKQPFLEIELIPFAPGEENGQWKKLTRISLMISYTPQPGAEGTLKSFSLKYASASRLSSGKWLKISTTGAGIHKIPYSTLSGWGFSNPEQVQIYGHGGRMVPLANSEERPDDLPQIAVWHRSNALYFYSPGTVHWQWNDGKKIYEHHRHKYSPRAFFFLSEVAGEPAQVITADEPSAGNTHQISTFDFLHVHELELENILQSGSQWFGEKFNVTTGLQKTFRVEFPQLIVDSSATLTSSVLGRSNTAHGFEVSVNGTSQNQSINTVTLSNYTGYYAHPASITIPFTPQSNGFDVSFRYTNPQTTSIGWLDYFTIHATGSLTLEQEQLLFRNRHTAGPGHVTTFTIQSTRNNLQVWEVTNPDEPVRHTLQRDGSRVHFKDATEELKTYVVFDADGNLPVPEMVAVVKNQNLHGSPAAEMVIVAPSEFLSQANRLAALHATHSGLKTIVAEREALYNEFSWGHPDPGAIRAFMKMLYDRAGDDAGAAPQLLLLFGDGSYDNRHVLDPLPAPLPTFQSENSIYQTATYVTDDFFGFLDDEEGDDFTTGRLDIGIGRLPVNTPKQATDAVNKIETYLYHQSGGKWKTLLTFIGDDGDSNIHMRDAERLTEQIYDSHPVFDFNKIYLDAFKAVAASTGKEFPGARTKIERTMADGTLLLNYTGHGSENGLAHEGIITRSDINAWSNLSKLPLFVTATCEFSRFDNHGLTSAGEEVFLNTNGGAFALLSTTRIVYSSLNYTLNRAFSNHVFDTDNQGRPLRLGEILRRTKIESGSSINKLSFTLLGDPALRINYPFNKVSTEAIVDNRGDKTDTIKALSVNTLKGLVQDPEGNTMEDFNGEVNIVVYDKAVETQTLGNNGAEPFIYKEYANILFKGVATVSNGRFTSVFSIPQDIRFNYGPGRISYYATTKEGVEAAGAFSDIIIGGIADNSNTDKKGPDLHLYLNHSQFNAGDHTGNRPMLYAKVFDESGINTSGIGIGHNITLVIDGNTQNPLIINDAFAFNPNSYQEGTIAYHLPELTDGPHEVTLKVWDIHNNSSTAHLSFTVSTGGNLKIRDFKVYPNPVPHDGQIYATFSTDAPNSSFDTTIDFIDMMGRVTGSIKRELIATGNSVEHFSIPLENSGWNRKGICFVRLIVTDKTGKKAIVVQKMLPSR